MNKFAYLIVEFETGFVDGWYMSESAAVKALLEWKERFPWLHYDCHCTLDDEIKSLPDPIMINRNYDDDRRIKPKHHKERCDVINLH